MQANEKVYWDLAEEKNYFFCWKIEPKAANLFLPFYWLFL
jgi:hypothetical protein